jgi:hypothetical protein
VKRKIWRYEESLAIEDTIPISTSIFEQEVVAALRVVLMFEGSELQLREEH